MAIQWTLLLAVLALPCTIANESANIPKELQLSCHGQICDVRFAYCDDVAQKCNFDCSIVCIDQEHVCTKTCPGHAVHKFYVGDDITQISTTTGAPMTSRPTTRYIPISTTTDTVKEPNATSAPTISILSLLVIIFLMVAAITIKTFIPYIRLLYNKVYRPVPRDDPDQPPKPTTVDQPPMPITVDQPPMPTTCDQQTMPITGNQPGPEEQQWSFRQDETGPQLSFEQDETRESGIGGSTLPNTQSHADEIPPQNDCLV